MLLRGASFVTLLAMTIKKCVLILRLIPTVLLRGVKNNSNINHSAKPSDWGGNIIFLVLIIGCVKSVCFSV